MLDCIRINPKSEASATVIWLHGLGADGHDFEPIIPELGLPVHCPSAMCFRTRRNDPLPVMRVCEASFDTLPTEQSSVNQDIPIMMAHGTWDPVVPIKNAIRTRRKLTRLGYVMNWHEYPMQHAVCIEEIQQIRSWLIDSLTLLLHK